MRQINIEEVHNIVDSQMYKEYGEEVEKLPFTPTTLLTVLQYMDKCGIKFQIKE